MGNQGSRFAFVAIWLGRNILRPYKRMEKAPGREEQVVRAQEEEHAALEGGATKI
jgi:hypothetical protein